MAESIKEHELVAKLIEKPGQPHNARRFEGYAGKSDRDGYINLYGSDTFSSVVSPNIIEYWEIPQDSVLHMADTIDGKQEIWIREDTKIEFVSVERFKQEARYLEGEIARAYLKPYVFRLKSNLANASDMAKGVALIGGANRVVSTIAVLKTLPKTGAQYAFVLGYYASGDGGGGMYHYDSLDTTTVDNGGSCIVAADGGRWKLDDTKTVSVKQFGAKGDGTNDDDVFIQKALNACTNVTFPDGTYKLTATLIGKPNHILTGTTPERCQFVRTAAYGHTLDCGTTGGNAGAIQVRGIWFNHVYLFNNGATYVPGTSNSITNKDPLSTHLKITNGQNVRISDCWFYGIGYGIEFIDSTILWVERCLFNGMWDTNIVGLQDSTAGIYCHASIPTNRCGLLTVRDNHIGGYGPAAATNVTTGNVTISHALNAGMKYGIYITSCERFTIFDNYIGGQSINNILIAASAICAHGTIHDNMLDGAGQYCIQVYATQATYYMNFLEIHHNTSVGYGIEQGFLWIRDVGSFLATTYVTIDSNIGQYYLKAPIRIERCRGVKLINNQMAAGNSDNATNDDPYIESGCVVDVNATYIDAANNIWGGGINDPAGPCNLKWGIFFYTGTNNTASLERARNLDHAGGTVVGGISPQTYPT